MEIAAWRGDKNLKSALSYMTDRKQMDETALLVMDKLYSNYGENTGGNTGEDNGDEQQK